MEEIKEIITGIIIPIIGSIIGIVIFIAAIFGIPAYIFVWVCKQLIPLF